MFDHREIICTYGLWDQLRFDKGKEWCLSIFINETLSAHRYNRMKPPHMQTTSKQVSALVTSGLVPDPTLQGSMGHYKSLTLDWTMDWTGISGPILFPPCMIGWTYWWGKVARVIHRSPLQLLQSQTVQI
jgi:hypothetical protein